MQADIDISDSDICVKECVVDGSHAHFVIVTKNAVVRLLMNVGLLNHAIALINLALPQDCKAVENKDVVDVSSRKVDMTLRTVDLRVGGPTYYRGPAKPELRLYSGKKRKHSIHMNLTWGQMALLCNLMKSVQEMAVTTAVA